MKRIAKRILTTSWPILGLALFAITFFSCGNDTTGGTNDGSSDGAGDTDYVAYSVGSGYNVFGEYANASSVLAPVLDFKSMYDAGVVAVTTAETSTTKTVSGASESEYAKSLGVDLSVSGGYAGFTASVESHFNTASSGSSSYYYTTIQSVIKKRSVKVGTQYVTTPTKLREYLTAEAKAALDGDDADYAEPAKLFKAFGTHVLVWGYYGGRLDYNCQTNTSQYSKTTNIAVYAKASYDNGVGTSASVEAGVTSTDDYKAYASATTTTLNLVGGSSQATFNILNESNYDAWTAAFDDTNYQVLCDFETGSGNVSLLPIWELCDSSTTEGAARAKQLKDYFATWATASSVSADTTKGSLTVNLHYIYNSTYTSGDDGNKIDLYWKYKAYVNGLNTSVDLQANDSDKTDVKLSKGGYINFASDGTWAAATTDAGTWYAAPIAISDTSKATSVSLTMKLMDDDDNADDVIATLDSVKFNLDYDAATDTWKPNATITDNVSAADYAWSSTDWTLARDGKEQLVDLIAYTGGEKLWTRIGLTWK